MQQNDLSSASGQTPLSLPAGKKKSAYELPHAAGEVAALAGGLAYYVTITAYPHQGTSEECLRLAQEQLDLLSPTPVSFLSEILLTNDREAFNGIFAACFEHMYYQVIQTCVKEPETTREVKGRLATLSPEELLAYTQAKAKESLAGVVVRRAAEGQGSREESAGACAVQVVAEKGIPDTMMGEVFPVGSRVRVISYGPFRGLKGTIRTVDTMVSDREDEEPFCFYKVALEGAHIGEPIWFEYGEVELVAAPSLVLQGRHSIRRSG